MSLVAVCQICMCGVSQLLFIKTSDILWFTCNNRLDWVTVAIRTQIWDQSSNSAVLSHATSGYCDLIRAGCNNQGDVRSTVLSFSRWSEKVIRKRMLQTRSHWNSSVWLSLTMCSTQSTPYKRRKLWELNQFIFQCFADIRTFLFLFRDKVLGTCFYRTVIGQL